MLDFSPLLKGLALRMNCVPLLFAGLVEYPNGKKKLVVAGGRGRDNNFIQSTEILDLDSMQWTSGQDIPDTVLAFSEIIQFEKTMLIVGGYKPNVAVDTILQFDPETEGWIERSEHLSSPKYHLTLLFVPDNAVNCQ